MYMVERDERGELINIVAIPCDNGEVSKMKTTAQS
jgi:hypothetical protein